MEYLDYMECEFLEAVYWDKTLLSLIPLDDDISKSDSWEFSKIVCNSATYELIENSTTSAGFWLKKTFSYGDFFVMGILTLFILFQIVKIIWDNFIKKNNSKQ